ncbi:farnesyldiphosphatesynthetase [Pterulicium gracile]|uniref:(2E,6E)-farnesyl diphosphate synthase n=1 Tax=Pterulicium gracile TaxID=1884261 RepID=A0A5C3R6Z6_9AGAR|nr:farnesyldiphosphatesynthetase [Pterula gracilis]
MGSVDEKKLRRAKFEEAYHVVKKDLVDHVASLGMPEDVQAWYSKSLDYNLPGGKLNRGLSVVDTVEILKGQILSEDEYLRAAILGWCVELFQAFFLVHDDQMDGSVTRRGQPCWYHVAGNVAINDGTILESAMFYLIKKYFRRDPHYVEIVELVRETVYRTEMGQLIDTITSCPRDSPRFDLSKFNLNKYKLIVLYKTAYYSFYMPVALAMLMCGIPPSQETIWGFNSGTTSSTHLPPPTDAYSIALRILLPMGEYFQVQDDFLDAFGTPEQIGKVGTDIVDGKCSWVVCAALERCDAEQRKVLDEHYGVHAPEGYKAAHLGDLGPSEKRVKGLYVELGLGEVYARYEEESYGRVTGMIEWVDEEGTGLRKEVFVSFLEKIYKRTK